MDQIITAHIDEDGNVKVDLTGFRGSDCLIEEERIRHLLQEMGLRMSEVRLADIRQSSTQIDVISSSLSRIGHRSHR